MVKGRIVSYSLIWTSSLSSRAWPASRMPGFSQATATELDYINRSRKMRRRPRKVSFSVSRCCQVQSYLLVAEDRSGRNHGIHGVRALQAIYMLFSCVDACTSIRIA